MNKFPIRAAAAALIITPMAATAQRPAAPLILIVDTNTIYRTCTACVAAQAQLQAQINAAQSRRQQLTAPLQTEMQSLEQAATAARNQTGAARTSAEAALQTRLQALQTRQDAANQELAQLEMNIRSSQQNVSQQIDARLSPILQQVMNTRGANIVLPKGATLANSDALDVTAEVLRLLNQQLPSVTVAPLPQQPAATPGR